MYIYIFLLKMTDTMTSQNIDISSGDILYILFKHTKEEVTELYRKLHKKEYTCRPIHYLIAYSVGEIRDGVIGKAWEK